MSANWESCLVAAAALLAALVALAATHSYLIIGLLTGLRWMS